MVEHPVAADYKWKKYTRATCKAALEEVNKSEDNCPIVLEKMTFNVFSHYVSTKKSKKSGEVNLCYQLWWVPKCSHSYVSYEWQDDGWRVLKKPSQFMSGMKRVVAANKRKSGASLDEGKKAMSSEVYKRLCEELYNGKGDEHLFSHALFTMEWNLMARSDNCINIHVQNIQWRLDSLIFYFETSKGNHTGNRSYDTWHVYSKPNDPKIILLSL